MKEIPLTQGKVALVDDEDYLWLSLRRWSLFRCGAYEYAIQWTSRHSYIFMHRLILGLSPKSPLEGDHANHNGLDNRRSNIRAVTHQQNQFNRRSAKGYSWDKARQKYHAQIMLDGRNISLGRYADKKAASMAYAVAKREYHGSR